MASGRSPERGIARLERWLTPATIAVAYVLVGLVLLALSDLYWPAVVEDSATLRELQGLKGALEVLVTGGVIYGLVRLYADRRRQSEERYRQLLETSPAPINLFDADGLVVWGNDAVLDLLGLEDRSALVGRSIFEFIDVEDHERARAELRAVIEGKQPVGPTRMRLTPPSGPERDVRVSTAPGRYEGRDVGQAVVVDDTRRLDLQSDLAEARRFTELALDSIRDVFYVLDADGDLVRWNARVEAVTGFDHETIASMRLEEFFVPADRERVRASVERVLETGEDDVEATVVTRHGRAIEYEFRGRRLTDTDGEVVGMVGIGRDVSARVARDRHLWNVDRLLQHQLRNKLNVVIGLAEQLGDAEPTPEDAESTRRIVEVAGSVLSLVEKNHEIVETLTRQVTPHRFDLVPVATRAVETVRRRYPDANVEWDLPGEAVVTALPKLEAVVVELLENAIVHGEDPDPWARLSVTTDGEVVRLEVADEAPPIPRAERELVAGERAFGTTAHTEGLGLWLVHWTVMHSGGTLSFDVTEPRGNVVTVELPAAEADGEPVAGRSAREAD